MTITALDIQQQGFEHAMRGYNIEQVDVFLERVAQEVDLMTRDNDRLRAAVAEQSAVKAAEPAAVDTAELDAAIARAEKAEAALAAAEEKASLVSEQASSSADATKAAEARLAAANDKIAELERRLSEKGDTDTAIANAFISAQRAADNLKEEARAEGERIYRESEAKAREFIREALIEKQRILNEVDALTVSCEKFRSEYRAMLEHFTAEAEHLTDIQAPVVTESAVDAVLPDITTMSATEIEEIPVQTELPTSAALSMDDLEIEEID